MKESQTAPGAHSAPYGNTPARAENAGLPRDAVGELVSETRPLDRETVTVEVKVRYQACDDRVCLLPKTENLELEIPLDVIDGSNLSFHAGALPKSSK